MPFSDDWEARFEAERLAGHTAWRLAVHRRDLRWDKSGLVPGLTADALHREQLLFASQAHRAFTSAREVAIRARAETLADLSADNNPCDRDQTVATAQRWIARYLAMQKTVASCAVAWIHAREFANHALSHGGARGGPTSDSRHRMFGNRTARTYPCCPSLREVLATEKDIEILNRDLRRLSRHILES